MDCATNFYLLCYMFIAKWPFTKQQNRTYLTLPHKLEVFWIELDKSEVLHPAGFGNKAVPAALNLCVSGSIPGSWKVTAFQEWNWPFLISPNSSLQAVISCSGAVCQIWALLQLLWARNCPGHPIFPEQMGSLGAIPHSCPFPASKQSHPCLPRVPDGQQHLQSYTPW